MNGFWRDGGLLHYRCGVCGARRTIPTVEMEERALFTLNRRAEFTENKYGIPCDGCWPKVREAIAKIDPNGYVKPPPVYFT